MVRKRLDGGFGLTGGQRFFDLLLSTISFRPCDRPPGQIAKQPALHPETGSKSSRMDRKEEMDASAKQTRA